MLKESGFFIEKIQIVDLFKEVCLTGNNKSYILNVHYSIQKDKK